LATNKTSGTQKGQITKEALLLEAQRLHEANPKVFIGRDFWRANAKYSEKQIAQHWSRFKDFVKEAKCYPIEKLPDEKDTESGSSLLFTDKYIYNKDQDTYVTFLERTAGKNVIISGSAHRAMKDAYSNWTGKPESINEICRTFSMPRPWFVEYKTVHEWTHDSEPVTKEELLTKDEDELVEDILQKKTLSLLKKVEKAGWRKTQQNADKWVNFEHNVLHTFESHIYKNLPSYKPPMLNLKKSNEPFAVVLSPFDLHYGKYGWEDETGSSYSREEARSLLIKHTTLLCEDIVKFGKPEKIICGSGSDWLHIDNPHGTTTRGTPQDIDGTYSQIVIEGSELAHDHVEMLRQVAPVEWIPVPGNHDRASALTVMLYLRAVYKDSKDVTIKSSPARRQYVLYGDSLLGFSHGDTVKPADCHAVMVKEASAMWAQSKFQYMFTGHLHHEVIREIHGITTIQLKSLSGIDRFHSNNGYITSGRSLQAFVVSQDRGITAQLVSPVKNDVLFGMRIKKQKA
jgi:predicted phosphodiesterase